MSSIVAPDPQRMGQKIGRQFDAEERVLADFIEYPSRRSEIAEIVNVYDFIWPCHREAFSTLKSLMQRCREINPYELVAELVARGRLDGLNVHVGGLVACLLGACSPTEATALDAARALRAESD